MRNKINPLAGEWIRKAQDDELSIEAIMKEEGGAPSTVCFLSQQIAEKSLKASLVNMEKDFPRIHHLERLLGLCKESDKSFSELDEEAVVLTEYYIETRYPGDYPEGFTWEDARNALKAAKKIKKFVLDKLL